MVASLTLFLVVYGVASETFNRQTGYVAAALTAVTPHVIVWGSGMLVDLPMILLLTLGTYSAIRLAEDAKTWQWITLALSIGFAAQMKPVALFVGPVLWTYIFWQQPDLIRRSEFWGSGLGALGIVGVYFLTGIAANVFIGLDWAQESALHWFDSAPTNNDPDDPTFPSWEAIKYYLNIARYQFGPAHGVLAIGGLITALKERENPQIVLLLALIGWTYLFFTVLPNKAWRYSMPLVPFALVLAAGFAMRAATYLAQAANKKVPTQHTKRVALVAIVLVSAVSGVGATVNPTRAPAPDTGIDEAATVVDSDPGATVLIVNQSNWVSEEALTFYMAANDPQLDHTVIAENMSRADWIVSTRPLEHPDWEREGTYGDGIRTYLYRRAPSS
jgi:4-amino-4-deoxy-L-arabinose transferase-like glycosyltransferase